jgi:hypothetical protein
MLAYGAPDNAGHLAMEVADHEHGAAWARLVRRPEHGSSRSVHRAQDTRHGC